ncbi:MAG: chromate resistance protein ChrB domain-containing protein [Nitrospirota bacterium]
MRYKNIGYNGWLIFFYSVPSRPVSSRMKVWRRLSKAGAIQFKGAVYILPFNDEHYELLQWLTSEVASMKGEAAFIKADMIEAIKNSAIVDLFNQQRESVYRIIEKKIEDIERKLNSVKKGADVKDNKKLSGQFIKHQKEFEEIRKVDFFVSKSGNALKKRLANLQAEVNKLSGLKVKAQIAVITPKRIENYKGKTWRTRKRPFVDRMASAWLIKRFIDKKAIFRFIDEKEIENIDKKSITFDIKDGEFTHRGDMCTFEVIVKSFNLKDKALKKIAEIVHEIDMKDDKYENMEARGIEDILTGIRKAIKNDAAVLEKGMAVFEMLYASKT